MRYLTVDGELSGTGIRDSVNGGYVDPETLGLGVELLGRISRWVVRYENAHYDNFVSQREVVELDAEGVQICQMLRLERPSDDKIDYFSSAKMQRLSVPNTQSVPLCDL